MGINIVDMGLIENIEIIKDNKTIAKVTIKPTNPACMSAAKMAMDAKQMVENVEGVDKAEIIVTGHLMSDVINEMVNKE